MAKLIQAIRAYGPRIKFNDTVDMNRIARWISSRTTLNEGEVSMVLKELQACVLEFTTYGAPVKLEGLGRFAPSVTRNGEFRVNVRIDPKIKKGINVPDAFTGGIQNRQNIGLDNSAYKVKWDAEHPDDPLEI